MKGGEIYGACLNGRADNLLYYTPSCWSLAKAEPKLSEREAMVRLLRLVIAKMRGDREPFLSGDIVYGLAAVDLWAKQMGSVPGFCAECQQRSNRGWADAVDNARPVCEGAKVAASYLRKTMPKFSPVVRPRLESAAKHYDLIVELLTPALTDKGTESYQQFIGDLPKQKAHVENVLRPVKAELAAAADAMEQVLNATAAADGKEDG